MHEIYFKNVSTEESITFKGCLRRMPDNVKEEL